MSKNKALNRGQHDSPTVSIVVLTYNRCNDLKRCLNSLMNQTFQDFQIIIIDNGSTDDTPNVLKQYDAIIIRDPTKCLPYLANLGWKKVSSDIIAYIADDAEADKQWLENIVKVFNEYDDLYAVTGPTISMNPQEMLAFFNRAVKSRLLGLIAKIYNIVVLEGKLYEIGVICESGAYSIGGVLSSSMKIKKPIEVDLLTMTNVGIKRSLLVDLKGFDESYFFHYDGDFWLKAKRSGHKLIFSPKVIVWHYVNPSGGVQLAYHTGRDYAIFYLKNFHPASLAGRLRLLINITYFLAFWLFKATDTRRISYLAGLKGFTKGFFQYLKIRHQLI